MAPDFRCDDPIASDRIRQRRGDHASEALEVVQHRRRRAVPGGLAFGMRSQPRLRREPRQARASRGQSRGGSAPCSHRRGNEPGLRRHGSAGRSERAAAGRAVVRLGDRSRLAGCVAGCRPGEVAARALQETRIGEPLQRDAGRSHQQVSRLAGAGRGVREQAQHVPRRFRRPVHRLHQRLRRVDRSSCEDRRGVTGFAQAHRACKQSGCGCAVHATRHRLHGHRSDLG